MSTSNNTLVVSSGPLAEISVLDGSMNTVARSVGELRQDLAPGLYKVRVRNGPGIQEQLVSLDQNRSISIEAPPIFSPIPLHGTTRSHEYHMQRAVEASSVPKFNFGVGSGLFIFVREWSATGTGTNRNPAEGLTITDEHGNQLKDVGQSAALDQAYDSSAAWCARVDPGAYRLQLSLGGGKIMERALFASPNCQTQIFILLSPSDRDSTAKAYPDIAGGAVVISPQFRFDPQDNRTQLGEIARYALTQKRHVLSDQIRAEIVNEKFDDPMLGLLGAHLVLRDEPDNIRLFDIVTQNLTRLLGPNHPDLRALCLRRSTPLPQVPRSFESPPMLRASWDLAVAASLDDPGSFPEAGSVADIADKIAPAGSWLVWRREPALGSLEASRVPENIERSVQDFVQARARLEASRPANTRGVSGQVLSSVRPRTAKPSITDDDKADLARVLGIPGPQLEAVLKKILD